jgi:hypothetical protein
VVDGVPGDEDDDLPRDVHEADDILKRTHLWKKDRRLVLTRLAYEGVPIAAIARSFKMAFDTVEFLLREAVAEGFLLAMPAPDWPPGSRVELRMPTMPPLRAKEVGRLTTTFCRMFGLTSTESRAFTEILRRTDVTKEQIHSAMSDESPPRSHVKIVDVIMCKMRRKLRRHNITIETLWGRGYAMPQASKDVIRGLLRDYDGNGLLPPTALGVTSQVTQTVTDMPENAPDEAALHELLFGEKQ